MKRRYCLCWFSLSILLAVCAGCTVSGQTALADAGRSRVCFDQGWRFKRYDFGTDDSSMALHEAAADDSCWRQLNLPHDWAIEGGFQMDLPGRTGKLPYPGIGWYRKHFMIPESDKGKRIFLDFDGAMSHTQVWLNGESIGQWPYGYASFRLELTDHIRFGKHNVLAVRLNNPDSSSRWYPGGGIYRHTWLVKTAPVHIAHWGTSVTTPQVSDKQATVRIAAEIQNQLQTDATVSLKHEIFAANNPDRPVASAAVEKTTLAAGTTASFDATLECINPALWSIEKPTLYTLQTTVMKDGRPVDTYQTPFGIRTAEFHAKKGFLLNGKRLYLKGVCLHHDLGPLGAAVHRRGIERQLEILKEMGCNSIRTSHNPPTPELLELCDRMGFVVIDEAFDCWKTGKTPNDYQLLYDEWHEKDIVSLVRRDRNHPCVIAWSSGNEVREQNSSGGHAISRHLTSVFHREDPTRPVTVGCNNPKAAWNGFADTVDVFGFNYKPNMYKQFMQKRPNQPFYSSESASCISSRGEYFFPVSENKAKGFFNYQVSSYDLYAPGWAMPPDREFMGQDETAPACAGEYVWTGFDYIGEPTPYNNDKTIALNYHSKAEKKAFEERLQAMGGKSPSRSSYFGIMDLCGFKKDRFYIYQARWRPELPMAHILPHWNWPQRAGKVTPVHVYTSGDEAELFLNGKSLGRKRKQMLEDASDGKINPNMNYYRLRWDDVVYEPGTLKVVAYKNGRKWAEDIMKTTGEAAALQIDADRTAIDADGRDLSYVTVRVTDKDGLMVPRSNPKITFSIDGPGEIIATGNGDATNHTSFLSKERKAYNGMCLAIVRSQRGKTGTIRIKAESDGLAPAQITITSQ